jgi:hypothetical protein
MLGRPKRCKLALASLWEYSSSIEDHISKAIWHFSADSGCRDRALSVPRSNMAKQATLVALLDPSTHCRPPLTHISHHRPALVELSRFRVSLILTHSRFRRFSMCVSGVTLVGVSLLSADVVRPEVISQRVFISRGRTRAHLYSSNLSSRRTPSYNNPESAEKCHMALLI